MRPEASEENVAREIERLTKCVPRQLSGAYRMSTLEEGVRFDFDGDGIATQTAWPADTNAVAFLVHDRTWNGRIDNGTELFANATPVKRDGKSGIATRTAS